MNTWYNENDAFAAAWLRNLITEKVIADGEVDERSIEEVQTEDLRGFTQCHFFAGIGVWSYALRLAGWPDDRPVWTGSCPCPSFSAAGQGKGFDDPRHLWPAWSRLIRECKPTTVFGEQVDDATGHGWLDLVQTDLERENYAVGKAVFGACSVGAPQISSRLYFVAEANASRLRRSNTSDEINRSSVQTGRYACGDAGTLCAKSRMAPTDDRQPSDGELQRSGQHGLFAEDGRAGGVDLPHGGRREQRDAGERAVQEPDERCNANQLGASEGRGCGVRRSASGNSGRIAQSGATGDVGETERERLEGHAGNGNDGHESRWLDTRESRPTPEAGPVSGFWSDAEWLYCTDGRYRPVEPGTFPLAHGIANRVGLLRGYGNAIVPQQAQAFIEAYMSST